MRRLTGLSLLALTLLAGPLTRAAASDPYRLGAEDKVDVRVFSRPDLSVSLKIDGDGNLRLPLAGSVRAAGLTIDELETRLAGAWRDSAGILDPRVTVTVPETGPIFIGGAVQNPGRYAWASDLTAAKAYVLAGGAPRLFEQGGPLVAFEAYRTVEQEDQTVSRLAALLLRQARLGAEATSAETFEPPSGWASGLTPAQAAELLERERLLFVKRRESLGGEINNMRRQTQILADQKVALEASLANKLQQRDLLRQELTAIAGENENARLVPVTRLLALRRSIVDAENDQREIERRISENKLQSAISDQTISNLQNSRVTEASGGLADVERELVTLRDSLGPVRRRAAIGRRAIGSALSQTGRGRLSFTIRREIDGKTQVLTAEPDTKVLPRDLLQIVAEQEQAQDNPDAVSEARPLPGPAVTATVTPRELSAVPAPPTQTLPAQPTPAPSVTETGRRTGPSRPSPRAERR